MKTKDMVRLIADNGKLLTDGNRTASVVDCPKEDLNCWREIDDDRNEQNMN